VFYKVIKGKPSSETLNKAKEKVKSDIIITPINSLSCRYYKSENIVKKLRLTSIMIYRDICVKNVGNVFYFNIGFDKMHASPQAIISAAIHLYFKGESFRNIKQFLKLQGKKVSHLTIYK
jgi:hypothetical protein